MHLKISHHLGIEKIKIPKLQFENLFLRGVVIIYRLKHSNDCLFITNFTQGKMENYNFRGNTATNVIFVENSNMKSNWACFIKKRKRCIYAVQQGVTQLEKLVRNMPLLGNSSSEFQTATLSN